MFAAKEVHQRKIEMLIFGYLDHRVILCLLATKNGLLAGVALFLIHITFMSG